MRKTAATTVDGLRPKTASTPEPATDGGLDVGLLPNKPDVNEKMGHLCRDGALALLPPVRLASVLGAEGYGSIFRIPASCSVVNAFSVVVLTLPAIPKASSCAIATSSLGPSAIAT